MKLSIISNLLVLVILVIFGTLMTQFVVNNIRNSEKEIINNHFDRIVDETTNSILNNLTSIHDQGVLIGVDVNNFFNTNTSLYVPELQVGKSIMNKFISNSIFTVFSVALSKTITTFDDRTTFLKRVRDIYNDQGMIIFGISETGSIYEIPEEQLPLQLITILNLEKTKIGVPTVGILDIYSVDPLNEIDILLNMTENQFNLGRLSRIQLSNDDVLLNIAFNVYVNGWLVSITFEPSIFLQNIIKQSEELGLYVIVSESITGQIYKNFDKDVESISNNIEKEKNLRFITTDWVIQYVATNEFIESRSTNTDTIIMILFIVLFALMILFIVMINFILKYISDKQILEKELQFIRKLKITNHSVHFIIHEIRNLLSAPFSIFKIIKDNSDLDEEGIQLIRESISSAVSMSTHILDFEQLILEKYEPIYESTDVMNIVNTISKGVPFKITVTYNDIGILLIDQIKFREMFNNGFINACKHTEDRKIFIRVQIAEELLLVEIINSAPQFSLTEKQLDKIFTPFFLKSCEKEELWDENILKKFKLDKQFYDKIKVNFGHSMLKNTVKSERTGSEQFVETESTGLGLGLARLIAKNLGGDLNIEFDSEQKLVRFWFAIKIERDPNTSHNSEEQTPVDIQVV